MVDRLPDKRYESIRSKLWDMKPAERKKTARMIKQRRASSNYLVAVPGVNPEDEDLAQRTLREIKGDERKGLAKRAGIGLLALGIIGVGGGIASLVDYDGTTEPNAEVTVNGVSKGHKVYETITTPDGKKIEIEHTVVQGKLLRDEFGVYIKSEGDNCISRHAQQGSIRTCMYDNSQRIDIVYNPGTRREATAVAWADSETGKTYKERFMKDKRLLHKANLI